MLRFYVSLLRELPAAFRAAAEAWGFWVWTIGAPALVLLNPQLDRWISTPQVSRRFVFVPIAVSILFVMLRANYRRFEEMRHVQRPVTADDWMEMADQFRTLHARNPGAWDWGGFAATWHQVGERKTWFLTGGEPETRRELEALCKRAGAMLLKSPAIAAHLSREVAAFDDPVERWLAVMKEQPSVAPRLTGSTIEHGTEGENETFEKIAAISVAVCVTCSADEI